MFRLLRYMNNPRFNPTTRISSLTNSLAKPVLVVLGIIRNAQDHNSICKPKKDPVAKSSSAPLIDKGNMGISIPKWQLKPFIFIS